ncbi:MAG: virulence factor [Hyphomicrobiaceae bacterium]
MATLRITYWRDIPAMLVVRDGRRVAKRELPARFAEAIDMAAMRAGAHDTDRYLADWRQSKPIEVVEDIDTSADSALTKLLCSYDESRLKNLVSTLGVEGEATPLAHEATEI